MKNQSVAHIYVLRFHFSELLELNYKFDLSFLHQ